MVHADAVVDLYMERVRDPSGQHAKMAMIRQIYNGESMVELPDINGIKAPPVPNLVAQGIDQIAGRIASVVPSVNFVPKKRTMRRDVRRAQTASRVIQAWWQADRFSLKMRQRARHLVAYAYSPVVIGWDYKENRPTWQVRDPLTTFPDSGVNSGQDAKDVIFSYRRSVAWLMDNGYGWAIAKVVDYGEPVDPSTPMQLLEYFHDEYMCLVLLGQQKNADVIWGNPPTSRAVLIEESYLPIMTAFVPSRISLDAPIGQFDNMISMYHTQARLAALEVMAVEKGIFPDTYLVSRPGELGKFIDGPFDGRTGQVNVIAGGDVKEMNPQPGYLTNPTIDRLERNQRVTAGIPAEFGGESQSNIRTGRRGDSILSATIDHPVGEAQEIFSSSLERENAAAIALAKHFDGQSERTFYLGTGNSAAAVTFTADDALSQDQHMVSYPAVGSDMNSLIIGLGQRVGLGTMSKKSAAELDPYISDAENEHDQIIVEGLETALLTGVQQQASSGQIPPAVLAKLISLVGSDKMELADAMNQIAEDAAKEQAAMQAQQQQGPPQPMSAEQQMAGPAGQAMTGPGESVIPGANKSQQSLNSMLLNLRGPNMGVRPGLSPGTV